MIAPCVPKRTVAIVMPSHNYARFVEEAVRSVFAQTFTDWVLCVVDDGSTDQSLHILHQLAIANPHRDMLIASRENTDVGQASRNVAIEMTRDYQTKWIVPLDADDMLARDYLERTLAFAEEMEDPDWVYTDIALFGEYRGFPARDVIQVPEMDFERLRDGNFLPYCALIKRAMLEDIGGYRSEVVYADWDLWLRAVVAGYLPSTCRSHCCCTASTPTPSWRGGRKRMRARA